MESAEVIKPAEPEMAAVNWLNMASSIFKMIYTDTGTNDIEIKIKGGTATLT